MIVSHGKCGKSWDQHGEKTSHCGGCHETFASLRMFMAHRSGARCNAPGQMTFMGDALDIRADGIWHSARAEELGQIRSRELQEQAQTAGKV